MSAILGYRITKYSYLNRSPCLLPPRRLFFICQQSFCPEICLQAMDLQLRQQIIDSESAPEATEDEEDHRFKQGLLLADRKLRARALLCAEVACSVGGCLLEIPSNHLNSVLLPRTYPQISYALEALPFLCAGAELYKLCLSTEDNKLLEIYADLGSVFSLVEKTEHADFYLSKALEQLQETKESKSFDFTELQLFCRLLCGLAAIRQTKKKEMVAAENMLRNCVRTVQVWIKEVPVGVEFEERKQKGLPLLWALRLRLSELYAKMNKLDKAESLTRRVFEDRSKFIDGATLEPETQAFHKLQQVVDTLLLARLLLQQKGPTSTDWLCLAKLGIKSASSAIMNDAVNPHQLDIAKFTEEAEEPYEQKWRKHSFLFQLEKHTGSSLPEPSRDTIYSFDLSTTSSTGDLLLGYLTTNFFGYFAKKYSPGNYETLGSFQRLRGHQAQVMLVVRAADCLHLLADSARNVDVDFATQLIRISFVLLCEGLGYAHPRSAKVRETYLQILDELRQRRTSVGHESRGSSTELSTNGRASETNLHVSRGSIGGVNAHASRGSNGDTHLHMSRGSNGDTNETAVVDMTPNQELMATEG